FLLSAMTVWLLTANALAQHVISGSVRDGDSNELLVNATVHLQKPDQYALTDAFGRFSFENVPAGEVVLRVTYIGYEEQLTTVNIPADVAIEIRLEPMAILTDAVIVRATRAT